MARSIRLGVIVPSSNTALEPLTCSIINSIPDVSFKITVHFTRVRVTTISLSSESNDQFEFSRFLEAARLLVDAHVDLIGWSGTSAGWLGFDTDAKICKAIEEETGTICTTSTLALNKALQSLNAKQFALVTPYVQEMNEQIRQNYATVGVDIPRNQMQHLGVTENKAIASIDESTLDGMVSSVIGEGATMVSTFCTNLNAAQRVPHWEEKYGVVILDTVATVVWDMLRIAGVPSGAVKHWGKLFFVE